MVFFDRTRYPSSNRAAIMVGYFFNTGKDHVPKKFNLRREDPRKVFSCEAPKVPKRETNPSGERISVEPNFPDWTPGYAIYPALVVRLHLATVQGKIVKIWQTTNNLFAYPN